MLYREVVGAPVLRTRRRQGVPLHLGIVWRLAILTVHFLASHVYPTLRQEVSPPRAADALDWRLWLAAARESPQRLELRETSTDWLHVSTLFLMDASCAATDLPSS
jgi:hypothetical protein